MRKPTAKPTIVMRIITKKLRTRSEVVRPASTAERLIGRARKRSMMPLCRSSASPADELMAPKMTVCTNTPGIRKLM